MRTQIQHCSNNKKPQNKTNKKNPEHFIFLRVTEMCAWKMKVINVTIVFGTKGSQIEIIIKV